MLDIENVIQTVDVRTIYEAPISFNRENLDKQVLGYFKINSRKKINLNPWKKITKTRSCIQKNQSTLLLLVNMSILRMLINH